MATENKKKSDPTQFYRAVNSERVNRGFKNQVDLTRKIGRHHNMWEIMKKGSTKFSDIQAIADAMGLQIVLRNRTTNTEHILNEGYE